MSTKKHSEINVAPAITATGISMSFRLPHNRQSSIKGAFLNMVSFGDHSYETQKVLKDVSFEIKKGEFFGIVGRNGSGKSTLLKLLAGIYTPTKGTITVNGSLTPFIELGVGFNPELTGRENVYLNGALLGFSNKEVDAMYDDIVSFAELERFMDQKLKNYSSGMQVRLSFSIAIRAEGDLLILDEVLAVGDEAFQKKCYNYFNNLKKDQRTVVLVTHDMGAVERYCTRAMMIEKGEIVVEGSSTEVAAAYRRMFAEDAIKSEALERTHLVKNEGIVAHVKTAVLQDGKVTEFIKPGKSFDVAIEYVARKSVGEGSLEFSIVNSLGMTIVASGLGKPSDAFYAINKGLNRTVFTIEDNLLTQDAYTVNIRIAKGPHTESEHEPLYQESTAAAFVIDDVKSRPHSLLHPRISVGSE
jgi:ABC-2 type transport system ATP-binding protein